MSELASQLVDRVLPHLPIRYLPAFDAGLTRATLAHPGF